MKSHKACGMVTNTEVINLVINKDSVYYFDVVKSVFASKYTAF